MRRGHAKLFALAPALALAVLVLSCTEGRSPIDPDDARMALVAVGATFPANTLASQAGEISRIRVTVLSFPDRTVLDVLVFEVDPDASEWVLDVEIPIGGGNEQRVLLLELISVVDGVETVEWSGETAPFTPTFGVVPDEVVVEVVRGPLDNLAVTSVSISDVEPLLEGGTAQLDVQVQTSRPDASPTVIWLSLDPEVASVDASGLLQALLPGTARITSNAGL